MEASVKRGLKICTNGHDLSIKMATMLIYGKTLKNLLQNQQSFENESWYTVCSNNDRSLTLDLFTERSNQRPHIFISGKC